MAIDWEAYRQKAEKQAEINRKKRKQNSTNNDIAPVPSAPTTVTAPTVTAPTVSSEKEDEATWFQKSEYFADGTWDKGDLSKTIFGSDVDIIEHVSAGILGLGEKIVDGVWSVASGIAEQQTRDAFQNLGLGEALLTGDDEAYHAWSDIGMQSAAEVEDASADFVQKDLYNEDKIANELITQNVKDVTGVNAETASIFGEKSDQLAKSGGELLGTTALQVVGVPWWVTTGTSALGGQTEAALQEGADMDEAVLSGLISAGAEILTEKIFGGISFGGKTLDDFLVKPLVDKISGKALKSLAKFGVDLVGEGAEEVVSEFISNLGTALYKEEDLSEILAGEEALQGYIDSFIGGAFLGGVSSGGKQVANAVATESEKSTVDKLVEERVAEETKQQAIEKAVNQAIEEGEAEQGGKFSVENKKALRETVLTQIESGEIDISSSETLKKEDVSKIKKEIKAALKNGEIDLAKIEGVLTPDLTKQINELKEALANTKDPQKRAEIEAKIRELEGIRAGKLKNLARENKYLAKAASEKLLSSQKYEYDAKVTDEYEKTVRESAKRYLNNSTAARKLVDAVSKLAKDKQTRYVFTNNQRLSEQGDLVARIDITAEEQAQIKRLEKQLTEAKTKQEKADIKAKILELKYLDVGGFVRVNDNGVETVLINVDSKQSMYSVVGHETKHVLEKHKLNEAFNEVLFKYAESKGDLDSIRQRIEDVYKNQDNVDIDGEVAAELTGKYLFEDEKFLETLMNNKSDSKVRQVIDKIKELIDDLVVRFKGTEQEKQLREVQKKFIELYNSTDVVGETTEGTQYAIDNNFQKQYNLSRKNDYGDNINDFYRALNKKQWSDFYQQIADNGYLEYTDIGDIATIIVGNKLVVAERKMTGKDAHDFQVNDVYEFVGTNDFDVLYDIRNEIEESGVLNGNESIAEKVFGVFKAASGKGNMYRFDRDKLRFVNHLTNGQNGNNDSKTNGLSETKSNGQRVSVGNEQNIQGTKADLNKSAFSNAEKTKYSLSYNDNQYIEAVKRGDNASAQRMVYEVAKANGYTVRAYHGTSRGDRVGNVFLPERATSGPMAFFTDNKEIAENYSKSKQDTSIAYDPDFDRYETQFRIKTKYQDIPLYRAWGYLPFDARNRITKKAGQLREDWDEDYELILDPETNEANGGFQRQLKEARGNALLALNEQWLNSGTLFNNESRFLDVLEMAGVTEEFKKIGMDTLYFKDPKAKHEKVYDTFLKITNPFDTASVNEQFVEDLLSWYENQDETKYVRESAESDLWDKNSIDAYDFAERLESDIENNTFHAWTSIPDSVTDYLKELGYDGIKDLGGKGGGVGHTVWIPFSSEQVKSAEAVTYDDNGDIIPLSERFNEDNNDIRYSLSKQGEHPIKNGNYHITGEDIRYKEDIAPTVSKMEKVAPVDVAPIYDGSDTKIDDTALKGIGQRLRETLSLNAKETKAIQEVVQKYSTTGLPDKTKIFDDIKEQFGEKSWKVRNEEIAEVKRTLKGFGIKVSDNIKSDILDYSDWKKKHQGRLNFSADGLAVDDIYMGLSVAYPGLFPEEITNATDQLLRMAEIADEDIYISASQEVDNDTIQQATDIIYDEVNKYKEKELAQQLAEEQSHFYRGITEEETAENSTAKTVKERIADEVKNARAELLMNQQLRDESQADYGKEISRLQAVYNAKRDKNTKTANKILRRIERLQRMKNDVDADYSKRISDIEARIEKLESKDYATVEQRKTKQQELRTQMAELVGDTSTWVDKKLGISYKVNTLRRNLRDIVRTADGKRDITKADAIYDELQGKYNHNEAELNRESNQIKKQFADMEITKAEDTYIQMLGEFRHNPETTLTEDVVQDFYEKHKNNIDKAKVDKVIEMARPLYDDLLLRVNQVLSEQGMKEIPYRKGYFPHFTEEKQGIVAKLFNWKTQNNDIPTDIAGLTETFEPNRSWQSFNKQRKSDTTDYSFLKGLDTYVQGSLDWIYHIEDIQKRRALENHIRYIHSEQGIKDRIDAIHNNEEYDAEEMQEQIDLVYKKAGNPLNNFVTDFRAATNTLAGKKSSLDRSMEEMTNRKFYSTMTNLSNRVSANMVGGSVSSALTNFIPITQSWGQVSPISSLRAMGDTIVSTFRDDGTINKSDFLTNRLRQSENLYKTGWDKIGDKVGWLMEAVDSFTSQTVWRSKYLENISKGMSENAAIKNADQFAENVMAGRSRGNMPTIFDSKKPLVKTLTMFQLEVNNQYGYMFKDMPQDMANESKAKLVKGYVTMFVGAYAYNALYSSLVGRDAAFDPIGIIEDLLRDLGVGGDDEDEEDIAPVDAILNLTENVLEEIPFVGGLLGGGRIPLSSALPYGGVKEAIEGTVQDVSEGNTETFTKEWLNPVYYLAMPMGGGQIKKSTEGLSMFSDKHPVSGSYTDSGNLRFPVEKDPKNILQAFLFGQYANKNARYYFDNDIAPLKEKQIQEFIDVDMPIQDYWEYREGLSGLKTLNEKGDYIGSLDLPVEKKNILINNIADRKEPIDYTNYDWYSDFEEFDFATRYPETYKVLQEQGISVAEYKEKYEETAFMYTDDFAWASENPEKYTLSKAVTNDVMKYKQYTSDLYNIKADKDSNGKSISGSRKSKVIKYIQSLDIDYGAKCILLKSEYDSDDTYNSDIVRYLKNRKDLSMDEKTAILEELGATVDDEGYVHWN